MQCIRRNVRRYKWNFHEVHFPRVAIGIIVFIFSRERGENGHPIANCTASDIFVQLLACTFPKKKLSRVSLCADIVFPAIKSIKESSVSSSPRSHQGSTSLARPGPYYPPQERRITRTFPRESVEFSRRAYNAREIFFMRETRTRRINVGPSVSNL